MAARWGEAGRLGGPRRARALGGGRRAAAPLGPPGPLTRRGALSAAAAALGCGAATPEQALASVIPPQRLRNRYWVVRVGESYCSQGDGVIKTNPGTKYDVQWGLTPRGERQVRNAAAVLDAMGCDDPVLYYSNFNRGYMTASLLVEEGIASWSNARATYRNYDPRPLGAYEGQPQALMEAVWAQDAKDAHIKPPPAEDSMAPDESAESVVDLFRTCLETYTRLESIYSGRDIVQVSHIDRTDVWQAALTGYPLERHHELAFDHGEVRLIDMRGYDEERPEETLKTCVAYGPRTLERLVEDGYCDVA